MFAVVSCDVERDDRGRSISSIYIHVPKIFDSL